MRRGPEAARCPRFLAPYEDPVWEPQPDGTYVLVWSEAQTERYHRATAALGGREPKAAYWCGGGWYVSPNPYAIRPRRYGDQPWQVWIPANPERRTR